MNKSGIVTMARRGAEWVSAAVLRNDEERGQGLVEYGLILVLIAIVVIVVLQLVGHQVNNVFSNVSKGLSS
jgi:pilus assembly protein Flp/PilA